MKGHARNLMTERVTAVSPWMSLEALTLLLVDGGLTGVPVVDESGKVVGVVSESDLLGALLRGVGGEAPVSRIMSQPPIVVDEFAPTEEVMGVFRESQIHHLPVVRGDHLVGIITPHDVLKFFREHEMPPPPEVG
jgi:CBS domain-containing protein